MNEKDRIIKKLVEQAKKYGYLTYDEINKTFDEYEVELDKEEMDDFVEMLNGIGVKIIDVRKSKKLFKDFYLPQEDLTEEESIKLFINEVSKIEPIDRKKEIDIAKSIRAKEMKLLMLVLSSPIALREINNWVLLVRQNEMTLKDLMKRGRKSKATIKRMRKKLISSIKVVNKMAEKILDLQKKLKKNKKSLEVKLKYEKMIEKLKTKIANKIISLELNSERIKRLIKRTKNITEKVIQLIDEVKKYEKMFSINLKNVINFHRRYKLHKISSREFKRIVGYTPQAVETILENYHKVYHKLQHYKKEINMSEEEIIQLDLQINQLNQSIEEEKMKLIQANLNLVTTFAKKFAVLTNADVNDLVQEGATGLAKAVEKFEWKKGYKFSTYAHWWIRQAISRYMADYTKTIRLPVHIRELVSKMIKVHKKLQNKHPLETPISIEEYSRVLKVPTKKIIDTLTVLVEPVSSHAPKGQNEDATIQDFIPSSENEIPFNYLLQNYKREILEKAMEMYLDEREKAILKLRYGFDGKEYTLEEVGKMFNITRERVRQIEAKAIRRLRSPEALEMLKEIYPVKD
ncbi:MAG: sigma-70 family RNA polymerase sigma factor [Elusimicrobiota bacterium]|nr:sigma-70 family RNA polymerase sigma factor [Endomicrobiia bacterium]MDW8165956.1 sigma-70 family RNA polymerase sigma factor [Elusimicrobiota bacterium]